MNGRTDWTHRDARSRTDAKILAGALRMVRGPGKVRGMTTTRVNHRNHDHPNTKGARAACRRSMAGFYAAVARIDAQVTARVAQRERELDDAFADEEEL